MPRNPLPPPQVAVVDPDSGIMDADWYDYFKYIDTELAALITTHYTRWTPGLSFFTPGNLAVTYALQFGAYRRLGNLIYAAFDLQSATFTHSTAAGNLLVTNLPFQAFGQLDDPAYRSVFLQFSGINKPGYTQVVGDIFTGGQVISISASGMNVALNNVVPADVPSGGTVILKGAAIYWTS